MAIPISTIIFGAYLDPNSGSLQKPIGDLSAQRSADPMQFSIYKGGYSFFHALEKVKHSPRGRFHWKYFLISARVKTVMSFALSVFSAFSMSLARKINAIFPFTCTADE
jgi:hypothetical protein